MSTMDPKISKIDKQDVLVRGYREIPAKLVAVAAKDGVVYATSDPTSPAIGFHSERVYAFNSSLFEKLRGISDPARLAGLWSTARPFVPVMGRGAGNG